MSQILTDSAGWGLLVGIALPLVQAVLQRPGWSANAKRALTLVLAVVGGVGTCWVNGELHQQDTLVQTISAVIVASQAVYNTLLYGATQSLEHNVNGGAKARSGPAAVGTTTGGASGRSGV